MVEQQKEVENNAAVETQSRASEIEKENQRLEEALKKRKELFLEEENLSLRSKLGGKSEAGVPGKSEAELEQEKIEAGADRIKGTLFLKKK